MIIHKNYFVKSLYLQAIYGTMRIPQTEQLPERSLFI